LLDEKYIKKTYSAFLGEFSIIKINLSTFFLFHYKLFNKLGNMQVMDQTFLAFV
jgi:hypothetical protein